VTRIISFNEEVARRQEQGMEVEVCELQRPIGEMITTSDGLMDLVQKVRVDVEFGRAEVPTMYEPIFRRIAPSGGFPSKTVDIGTNTLQANVVFFEKLEGGEVVFGTMVKGVPATGRLRTWAAGFQWTEDMEEWDSTWEFELVNQAFGRSYNHFLNHIHLSAIITYDHDVDTVPSYPAANSTAADATGANRQEKTLNTFQNAYKQAIQDVPQRTWSVILASEVDRFQIEESLLQPVLDSNQNAKPRVPVGTIIYYDGATIEMGTENYVYGGVPPGTCFVIFPKQRMLELVHHDLRVDSGNEDISRLLEAQIVGRTRRGLYAEIENSVGKVTLPT
jgi:hypothetical protein